MDEAFTQAVTQAIKKEIPVTVTSGKVTGIDGLTCTVERDGLPELLGVRLTSVDRTLAGQILITPRLNSDVLCILIENNEAEACVISNSEIDKIEIWFDENKTQGLRIDENGIIIDEGSNEGMVKAPEIKTQLDLLSTRVDVILDVLENVVSSCALHPNPAWPTIITPILAPLVREDFNDIQNERVQH